MRLPNAPLIEVIFELHWQVQVSPRHNSNTQFGYDPVLHILRETFKSAAAESGYTSPEFNFQQGPSIVRTVEARYRKSKDHPFPLLQIGPGIFACNLATEYEWTLFRKLCKEGLDILVQAFPESDVTPFLPEHLELRYIDQFNEGFGTANSFSGFLSKDTKIGLPNTDFLANMPFEGADQGKFSLKKRVTNPPNSLFELDIFSTTSPETKQSGIAMTSKVMMTDKVNVLWENDGVSGVIAWLDSAHEITSNFFRDLVTKELMTTFRKS